MDPLIATVVAVQALSASIYGQPSYFHLARCGGCGCPSFQQPCSLCNHYPMGERVVAPERPLFTCEQFEKRIAASGVSGLKGVAGNIATWYARANRNTVAYKLGGEWGAYKKKTDQFLADAQVMTGLASAADIYQAVAIENRVLSAAR